MKGDLITFDEIRKRTEIDIIRGTIEIRYDDKSIERGVIDDITWWPRRHPKFIEWENAHIWNAGSQTWIRELDKSNPGFRFTFEAFESFAGPYLTERGELFFLVKGNNYAVIFPVGVEVPPLPYKYKELLDIHCEIMGVNLRMKQ
jgi:hypothetical protein